MFCRLSRQIVYCLFLTFLLGLVSGCASTPATTTNLPGNASPPRTSEPVQESPTSATTTRQVPESPTGVAQSLQETPTLLTSPTPIKQPVKTVQASINEYVKDMLSLMDEHTLDAYEAQKLEALTDESQIETFRERAIRRLEMAQGMQPPPELLDTHNQVIASFKLLVSTWDLIKTRDYLAAREKLMRSYESLVDSVAFLSSYLHP